MPSAAPYDNVGRTREASEERGRRKQRRPWKNNGKKEELKTVEEEADEGSKAHDEHFFHVERQSVPTSQDSSKKSLTVIEISKIDRAWNALEVTSRVSSVVSYIEFKPNPVNLYAKDRHNATVIEFADPALFTWAVGRVIESRLNGKKAVEVDHLDHAPAARTLASSYLYGRIRLDNVPLSWSKEDVSTWVKNATSGSDKNISCPFDMERVRPQKGGHFFVYGVL